MTMEDSLLPSWFSFTYSLCELPPVAVPPALWGRYLLPASRPGCGPRKRDVAAWLQSLTAPWVPTRDVV